MKTNPSLSQSVLLTVFLVSLLWCVKSAELLFYTDLSWLGVTPLEPLGLLGILTAPLVHGSLEHIFNNTLPLLLLGSFLIYGYPKSRLRVIIFIWLISGLGVWLFARDATHIGASGISHGIFFYLLIVSMFRRDKSSIAIMMVAFFMYGGMTMTILPSEESISFEYHFFGGLAGTLAAILWHKLDPKPQERRYPWERPNEPDDPVIGNQWQEEPENAENDNEKEPIKIVKYH